MVHDLTASGTVVRKITPAYEEGVGVYKSSFQLPYSPHVLHVKVFETGYIFFRLSDDNTAPWIWWEGSKHNYLILKRDMFTFISKWQQAHAEMMVEQFFTLTYQASLVYFKLFDSETEYEN